MDARYGGVARSRGMKKYFWMLTLIPLFVSCASAVPLKPFESDLYDSHEAYQTVHLKMNIDSSSCPDWGEVELAVYDIIEDSGGSSAHIYSVPFKINLSKTRANISFLRQSGYKIVLCPFYGEDSHWIRYEESCWSEETEVSNLMEIVVKVPDCSHRTMKPRKHDPSCAPPAEP